MADQPVVHIGENSPEYVAFKLYHEITRIEARGEKPDRKWILDTYAECLLAVRQPQGRQR